MKTIEQIAAEILIESGYAKSLEPFHAVYRVVVADSMHVVIVNPFSDTLEGRRQADAIEDRLRTEHGELWERSSQHVMGGDVFYIIAVKGGSRQRRLDRIKWCLEQLRNKE